MAERFPKSAIAEYARDERFSILGECPTLKEVDEFYGDGGVSVWLDEIVRHICNLSSISVDPLQSTMAARTIFNRYGHLKVSEIMLFIAKFMAGDFEKFYKDFDVQVITRSMNQYQSYRNNVVSRDKMEKKAARDVRPFDGQLSFHQYLVMLQKAVYGDMDAWCVLRIKDYDMLVNCVCRRVLSGDFPRSILNHLEPVYREKAEEIIDRKNKKS